VKAPPRLLDRALPGLEVALDREAIAPVLTALAGEAFGGPIRVLSADILKHKPGRRCAIAYEIEGPRGAARLFAKLFGSDRGASVLTGMSRIAEAVQAEDLRVPRPLGYEPRLRLLLMEFLEGSALAADLYAGVSPVPAERMAAALAALHEAPASLPRRWTRQKELRNTREWIAALAGRGGLPGSRARELLASLEEDASGLPDVADTVVHRDFYADQVHDCGGRTAILDLDDARRGDPAVDVGNFLAHLVLRPLQFPETAAGCARARGAFLEAYRARRAGSVGEGFERRVLFYEATSLLRLAGVYAGRPRWSAGLPDQLLDACGRASASLGTGKQGPSLGG